MNTKQLSLEVTIVGYAKLLYQEGITLIVLLYERSADTTYTT